MQIVFLFRGEVEVSQWERQQKNKRGKKKKKNSEPVKSSLVAVKYVFPCVNIKNITFRSLIGIYMHQHGRISLFQDANQHNF